MTLNCLITACEPEDRDAIPFVAKDVFETAGIATTYGSRIFRDHVPPRTATAVTRMTEAGYALVGKANLHEFAWGATSENPHFGPVRNPLDTARIAGGSSGGSAAAIAGGLCRVALGTDTGGSIRIPAACCGVVGLKPTFGAVPLDGVWPLSPTLDHAGPLAATVHECAEAFAALAGRRPPVAVPRAAGTRVGVVGSFFANCAPGVVAAVERALEAFPRRTAVDFPEPQAFDNTPLFYGEAAYVHRGTFPARADEYGADVAERLAVGNAVNVREFLACRAELATYRARCARVFDKVDVLALPTVPIVAPPLGMPEVRLDGDRQPVGAVLTRNTRPFNNLGWPVLALPCGAAEAGLPASISLVGRPGDEWRLLALGGELERAFGGPRA